MPRLGLSLAPGRQRRRRRRQGVVVTEVDPDGPAAEHGFKTGDVILEVAGKTVATPADVRKALGDARAERQAQRADAREVGRGHGSSRFRSAAAESRVPARRARKRDRGRSAGNRRPRRRSEPGGRASEPVPTRYRASVTGIRRPRRDGSVEGRRSDPPPPHLY